MGKYTKTVVIFQIDFAFETELNESQASAVIKTFQFNKKSEQLKIHEFSYDA